VRNSQLPGKKMQLPARNLFNRQRRRFAAYATQCGAAVCAGVTWARLYCVINSIIIR